MADVYNYSTYPLTVSSGSTGGGGTTVTIGSMDAQAGSVNGAVIDGGQVFYQQSYSTTQPGLVTNSTSQNVSGLKSFQTGIEAGFLRTTSSQGASTGLIRAGNAQFLRWRNAANSGNLGVTVDANNSFLIDTNVATTGTLTINSGSAGYASAPVLTDSLNNLTVGSIGLTNQVSGVLPAANSSGLNLLSGSISLTTQVSGNLPISQTSGSVSLTNKVSGNLPLSQTSGSVSLLNQVKDSFNSFSVGSVSINSTPDVTSYFLQLPVDDGTPGQFLTTNGMGSTSWTTAASSGVTTVGTVGSGGVTANAARIGGSNIYLEFADGGNPGIVSNATQSFSGAKVFDTSVQTTAHIIGSTSSLVTLQSISSGAATNYTVTFPGAQGTPNTYMMNNGVGSLSWTTLGMGSYIGVGGSGSFSINGAVIGSNTIIFQDATQSVPGMVSSSNQTWIGTKTATSLRTANAGSANSPALNVSSPNGTFNNGLFVSVNAALGIAAGGAEVARAVGSGNFMIGLAATGAYKLTVIGSVWSEGFVVGSLTLKANTTGPVHAWTMPANQGSTSSLLLNDGTGALSWSDYVCAQYTACSSSVNVSSASGAGNIMVFGTKVEDTHSAYSGGVFTVPTGQAGTYHVTAALFSGTAPTGSGDDGTQLCLIKNSKLLYVLDYDLNGAASLADTQHVSGDQYVVCSAGHTLAIAALRDSTIGAYNMNNSVTFNNVTFIKVR